MILWLYNMTFDVNKTLFTDRPHTIDKLKSLLSYIMIQPGFTHLLMILS